MASFGEDSDPIKAGDQAPALVWTKVLSSPDPSVQSPPSLIGQVTALVFLSNVSAKEPLMTLLRAMMDRHMTSSWC
jgi:hypothetical protein